MAAKNNLKPKAYAKDNIDRWSYLTGYELNSLEDYTRDQIRALASKYGIKKYSSYKDMKELAKVVSETQEYKEAGKKSYKTIFEKVKDRANGESKNLRWYRSTLTTLSGLTYSMASR